MKGITFIVIMSVVWSIISAIIEKRAKSKKQLLTDQNQNRNIGLKTEPVVRSKPNPSPLIAVDPDLVRVEALRRKLAYKQAQQAMPPVPVVEQAKPVTKKKISKINNLHKETCDLPPTKLRKRDKPSPGQQISKMIQNRRNLRTAVVLSEILQKPISIRPLQHGR